jgi:hypothetical protein
MAQWIVTLGNKYLLGGKTLEHGRQLVDAPADICGMVKEITQGTCPGKPALLILFCYIVAAQPAVLWGSVNGRR